MIEKKAKKKPWKTPVLYIIHSTYPKVYNPRYIPHLKQKIKQNYDKKLLEKIGEIKDQHVLYNQTIIDAMLIAQKNGMPIIAEDVSPKVIKQAIKAGVKQENIKEVKRTLSVKDVIKKEYNIVPSRWIICGEVRDICMSPRIERLRNEKKALLFGLGSVSGSFFGRGALYPSFMRKNKCDIMTIETFRKMRYGTIDIKHKKTFRGVVKSKGISWHKMKRRKK